MTSIVPPNFGSGAEVQTTPGWCAASRRVCYPTVTPGIGKWSGRLDSNQRPPAPKAGALPGCATPRLCEDFDSTALSALFNCAHQIERTEHVPIGTAFGH